MEVTRCYYRTPDHLDIHIHVPDYGFDDRNLGFVVTLMVIIRMRIIATRDAVLLIIPFAIFSPTTTTASSTFHVVPPQRS